MRSFLVVCALALAGANGATAAIDKRPPSVPKGLQAVVVSSTQVDLSWQPSKDNVGVAGYRAYANGIELGTSATEGFSAAGLSAATRYSFTVAAYDTAANQSKPSKPAGAKTPPGGPVPSGPLLHASDLTYAGAFRLPAAVSDTQTFAYGGTALAYDPGANGLFAVGHDWHQLTAEVSIPPLLSAPDAGDLNQAGFLQPFRDATSKKIAEAGDSTTKIGGQLVFGGRLLGSVYVYYDAAGEQVLSHWARPSTSLTAGKAKGLYEVGTAGAGFVSGFMAEVPPEWRGVFGAPALTGNCCIPIIGRTSWGPAAFAFAPADLGAVKLVPAAPLLHYSSAQPTLGDWAGDWNPGAGDYFNGNSAIRGLVFPGGTNTVLYLGTQGTGPFCYGAGTDDPALDGQLTEDGETIWCYDPDNSSKGTHGYPYVAEVWAYDASELAAVRAGTKDPWEVTPYDVWTLGLPYGSGQVGGAAYDASNRLLYLSQQHGNGTDPVIHVFTVA